MASSTQIDRATFFRYIETDAFSAKNHSVADQIIITEDNLTWESGAISNVTFKQPVVVSHVDIRSGLAFYNCNFEGGIVFKGVTCLKFDIEKSKAKCSLYFSKCKMRHLTIAENCHLERNVRVENNSEAQAIRIFNSRIDELGFYFENSSVFKFFDLQGFRGGFTISKSILNCSVRFNGVVGRISLLESTIKNWVQFSNLNSKGLIFNKNLFEDTVTVRLSALDSWSIIGDTFNKKLQYENLNEQGSQECSLKRLWIANADFIEGADIRGNGKSIESLRLPITPDFKGVLRIQNWRVAELSISGINQNLKLLLCQMHIRTLEMIEFTNYADVTFERCQADNENGNTREDYSWIVMAHSDLGATRFTEMDFRSFFEINVENTSFDGIKCSNVAWFDDSQLVMGVYNNTTTKAHRTRREIYRQIKHSLKSQGNQIDSLLFQAREMRAHREELKSSNNYGRNDKLIMTVNRTNNYGLDWFKPLWIIGLITLGFYLIELPFFSDNLQNHYSSTWEVLKMVWNEFYSNFNVYWQMFNPARKFESVYGENRSAFLYFLDFFHRLILGIFIFQIIRAFRKFSGK